MSQLSKTSFGNLYGTTGTTFPDNTTEEISEGDMRAFGNDILDSALFISDNFIDEDSFASDSATKVPSQRSVKAYVDAAQTVTNPDLLYFETDDFIGGISLWSAAGTRTVSTFGADSTEKAVGVYQIGGTSTGTHNIYKGNSIILGCGNILTITARLAIEALSDGTDTYTLFFGMADTTSGTSEPGNGVYFRYTHSVNSGKYECVTRQSATETAADSGVTAAINSFSVFKIVVNATGTSVAFYINDVLVATNTTNIPLTTSEPVWPNFRQAKTAGSVAKLFYIDHYSFRVETSGGR